VTDRPSGGRFVGGDLATLGAHKSEMGKLVILPKIRDPDVCQLPHLAERQRESP
jgi:hypothetical protein